MTELNNWNNIVCKTGNIHYLVLYKKMIVSGTLQSFFIFCIYFSLLLTKIDILLLTKVHTLLELSVFLINVLFLSQDLIHGYHVTFTRFLLTVTVSQDPLYLMILIKHAYWQYILYIFLQFGFIWYFLHGFTMNIAFWTKAIEIKSHFITYQGSLL